MGPTTGSQNYNSVGNDTRLKTRIVTVSHLQCNRVLINQGLTLLAIYYRILAIISQTYIDFEDYLALFKVWVKKMRHVKNWPLVKNPHFFSLSL